MSLSSRDRKLLLVLAPLLVLGAYWMLLLGPRLGDARELGEPIAEAEQRRDAALAADGRREQALRSYRRHYAQLVRLARAIPTDVDVPGLVIQLERAAEGTGIDFENIVPAASAPADPARPGRREPVQAAAAPAGGDEDAAAASPVPGLTAVPLELTFSGEFFDLADLFRKLQRFVRTKEGDVAVKGRLLTIDGFSFDTSSFPRITAQVQATAYLAPRGEGAVAGGTPAGPRGGETASGELHPVEDFSPPAAAVTP